MLLVLSSVACRGLLEMRHGKGNIRIATGKQQSPTVMEGPFIYKLEALEADGESLDMWAFSVETSSFHRE